MSTSVMKSGDRDADSERSRRRAALELVCGAGGACRLCLRDARAGGTACSALDLYELGQEAHGGGGVTLARMVRDVCGVDMLESAELGVLVCSRCAAAATDAYVFAERARTAHTLLTHLLVQLTAAAPAPQTLPAASHTAYLVLVAPRPRTLLDRGVARDTRVAASRLTQLHEKKKVKCKRKNKVELMPEPKEVRSEVAQGEWMRCRALYPCAGCARSFAHSTALQRHARRAHPERKRANAPREFVCADCGKLFGSRASVRFHEESHRRKACSACGKSYKSKKSLAEHERLCGGGGRGAEAAYVCDACGKQFVRKASLATHVRTLHGMEKGFACEVCGKRFRTKGQVKGHRVVHTRERNDKCPVCGRYFITKYALLYHLRLHTGERPHACPLCDERFLSSSRLAAHRRVRHCGPREECALCFAKFYTKYSLRVHTRRHYNPASKLYCPSPPPAAAATSCSPPPAHPHPAAPGTL